MNFLKEFENLVYSVASIGLQSNASRNIDICKKRFPFNPDSSYTLSQIGQYYDIEGERVRQIEANVLKNLKKVLSGKSLAKGFVASDAVILEFESIKQLAYEQDYILIENDFKLMLLNKYQAAESELDLDVIRLILRMLDYYKISDSTSGYNNKGFNCWCLKDSFDEKAIESIFKVLKKFGYKAGQIKVFDLVVKAKKNLGHSANKELVHLIVKVCPEFQKVDDETIEVRFEYLPNSAEKAYRVLERHNDSMHFTDIVREVNYRLSSSETPTLVNEFNLKNQMTNDKRFGAIAKSGYWFLKKWDFVSNKTITELMELKFHKENVPQTTEQLFNFVSSKRPGVSKSSITTYLAEKPQFDRTGDGLYSLTSWGEGSVKTKKNSSEGARKKIKESLQASFAIKNPITTSELVELVNKETGVSVATIRKSIKDCDELIVVDNQGRSPLLKCDDLRLSSLDSCRPKKLLRDKIQDTRYNFTDFHRRPEP